MSTRFPHSRWGQHVTLEGWVQGAGIMGFPPGSSGKLMKSPLARPPALSPLKCNCHSLPHIRSSRRLLGPPEPPVRRPVGSPAPGLLSWLPLLPDPVLTQVPQGSGACGCAFCRMQELLLYTPVSGANPEGRGVHGVGICQVLTTHPAPAASSDQLFLSKGKLRGTALQTSEHMKMHSSRRQSSRSLSFCFLAQI